MSTPQSKPVTGPSPDLATVVERNITALTERGAREAAERPLSHRIADAVTRFTGSLTFVGLHLAVFGIWVLVNSGAVPLPKWDPTFVILATVASVEAIFLSTFVLISQNRMQALADERADLDLQVSLLAEHEVTRLITLVQAIAEKMGVDAAHDPELAELAQDVAPERVLDAMHSTQPKG
ncbi:MAG: hypothetical protein JWM62_2903 [Frankiales bacterium]|jgi:uncharacterized membrane protein|nr:hypothetical protein [Frankiales bacterium]